MFVSVKYAGHWHVTGETRPRFSGLSVTVLDTSLVASCKKD